MDQNDILQMRLDQNYRDYVAQLQGKTVDELIARRSLPPSSSEMSWPVPVLRRTRLPFSSLTTHWRRCGGFGQLSRMAATARRSAT